MIDMQKARSVDIDTLAATDWGELRSVYSAALDEIDLLLGAAKASEDRLIAAAKRAGIIYAGCDTPDDLADEIDRLRTALVEERAGRIQESRSGDFVSSTGEHVFCIVGMEECRKTARQQLEAEGKI